MNRSFHLRSLCGISCALILTAASASRAVVIYNATGGVEMGGDVADPNAPGGVGVGPVLADRFFNSVRSRLTSVTLNLGLNGVPLNGFTVDLWPDSTSIAGLPVFGSEIKIASVSDSLLSSSFQLYTFAPTSNIILSPNTFYDIGIDTGTVVGGSQVTNAIFGNTIDPGVLARPSVVTGAFYFHTVGSVDPNSAGPYEAIVNAAVPEPSSWALMVAGFGLVGAVARRRKVAIAA